MYPNNQTYSNNMYQSQPYQPQNPIQSYKKIIILVGAALLFILLLMWVAGKSTLIVDTKNASSSGKITVSITDKSGKVTTKSTTATTFKQSLHSGAYQVTVHQGDNSYVSYVNTKGFFRTTTVSASLTSESARQFVGNNPSSCMYYIGSTLLSSACGLGYEDLKVHTPATASLPTTTEDFLPQELYGPLEGVAHTKFGTVALIQQSYSEEEARGHYASIISDTMTDSNRTLLKGLDVNKTFTIAPYREGFIAYTTDSADMYYIAGLSVAPVKLSVHAPKNAAFKPYLIGVGNNTVAVTYSDNIEDDIVEYARKTNNKVPNLDVAILDGTSERHFTFKSNASKVVSCGNNRLCLLTDNTIHVYDIQDKKPRELFVISDAQDMQMTSKGFLAITKSGTMLINTGQQTGFIEYGFGKYAFCGLTPAKEGYVLCIRTSTGQKNALLIKQNDRTNDNVDKKVLELAATPNVSYVSPYGNYIYAVPDYGPTEYNAELGGDSYNPATVQRVNALITAAAEKTGLNKPPYTVVSTGF